MSDTYGAGPQQQEVTGDVGGQLTGQVPGQGGGQQQQPIFQKPREPYAYPPARPPSEWGKLSPFAEQARGFGQADTSVFTPQGRDVPNLMRNAVGFLGKNGSPAVSNAAMMMLFANKDFLDGYMKGYEWKMRIADAEMDAQRKRVIDLQQRESEDYGQAIGLADRDPTHFKNGLYNELWRIAGKYNDTALKRALTAGGTEAAIALTKEKDIRLQSLQAYTQNVNTLKAQEEAERIEREKLGEGGGAAPTARPAGVSPITAPGAPGTTAAAPTAPAAAPSAPGGLSPPVARSPYIKQQVHRALMGEKTATGDTERVQNAIGEFQAQQEDYFNRIRSDPNLGTAVKPDGTPDTEARTREILPMIDAADEGVGRRVRDILSGAVPSAAEAGKEEWAIPIALAGKIDPRFSSPRIEQTRETMRQRYQMQETSRALSDAETTLARIHAVVAKNVNDMRVLQERGAKITRFGMPAIDAWGLRARANVLGDPDVAAFNAQLEVVKGDAGRIVAGGASGTGMLPVYTQREMSALISGGATPDQIKRISETLISDYIGRVNGLTTSIDMLRKQRGEGPIPPDPLLEKLVGLGTSTPTITTKAQYDALPPGSLYIKDGKQYRKK